MTKLTIITINLNNIKGLKKTFDSLFKQTFKDFEYIVIDGGSTDGSTELINSSADQLSYWVSEKDSGVYQAMNKGIQKATGEYVLFLNSGDHLKNEIVLEESNKELNGAGIVYGNIFLVENDKKSWTGVYPDKLSFQHFIDGSLPHPASFIKRSLFEQVGLYDESLKICADWKFFLDAVCKYNISYKHINKTIAVFYLDGISSTGTSADIIKKEKELVFTKDYKALMEMHALAKQGQPKKNKLIHSFAAFIQRTGLINLSKKSNA